jgi:hypothetical protein
MMGKFLRSLTDGSLRCRYCGDTECLCMEDGKSRVEFTQIWHQNEHSVLIQFRKQVLPNGKKIPSGYKIWIPLRDIHGIDLILKHARIENSRLNKLRFD